MNSKQTKELRNWVKSSTENNCEDYIAIAINEKKVIVSVASSTFEKMVEMLINCAKRNDSFKEAITVATGFLLDMENQSEEGGAQ